MPFTERSEVRSAGFFSEVLRSLLTPAGLAAGFVVETANKQGSDIIQSTIINDLLEADLVIADLTDHNPNVLFELGVRMAEDRPVALVKASGTGRIFDVDNMLRVFEYSANLWPSTVEKDLPTLTRAHQRGVGESKQRAVVYEDPAPWSKGSVVAAAQLLNAAVKPPILWRGAEAPRPIICDGVTSVAVRSRGARSLVAATAAPRRRWRAGRLAAD